ncbi:MAG: FAD-binding protein [Nitrospira sp.]
MSRIWDRTCKASFSHDLCDLPASRYRYYGGVDPGVSKRPLQMGGVTTDLNGATTLPGLFAAGEVACSGVHGANRLASNSLLEGLVFGRRAGVVAIASADGCLTPSGNEFHKRVPRGHGDRLDDVEKVRNSLRRIMWGQVGLIRSRESLVRAYGSTGSMGTNGLPILSTRADLEVKNMVQVARCVAEAALWRENSVGAHYRSDFPGDATSGMEGA